MSRNLTRRSALGALTASAAAIATTTTAVAAVAAPVPSVASPDAALIEASRKLVDLYHRTDAAYSAMEEAQEACREFEIPDALFVRGDDSGLPMGRFTFGNRLWYGDRDTIEKIRGADVYHCRLPNHAMARRDEIVAAFDRWVAARKARDEAHNVPVLRARYDALVMEAYPIRLAVATAAAHTLAGVMAKVRAIASSPEAIEGIKDEFRHEITGDNASHDAIEKSIVLDLARLSGIGGAA